jgi:O-succinylhomoserine sulfhydrylase
MKHKESKAIRIQTERSQHKEHSTPLFLSSSFIFDTAEDLKAAFDETEEAYIYSRYSNPNTDEFIRKVCMLEGAEDGFSTASGMAAVFASLMTFLSSGDHILSCSSIFGATHTILNKYFPRWGITHSYFEANQTEQIEKFITPKTKILFLETPTNPAIEIIDLELMGKIAKKHNLLLIVDNCFATPVLQRPIEYGAHLVIHSATKYMDGQGRVLGGCVVGKKELIREIYLFARVSGPSLSPFNAWTLSKSLETLSLRMERHCENALYVAEKLEGNKHLDFVRYPFLKSHPQYAIAKKQMSGGGGIVTFSLKGGYEAGSRFMNKLKMIRISPNLGDSRSIATHPASSTHCKLSEEERLKAGITPGLIRISVGLENKDDILEDIVQALG